MRSSIDPEAADVSTTLIVSRFCRDCGASCREVDRFCGQCGIALTNDPALPSLASRQPALTAAPTSTVSLSGSVQSLMNRRLAVFAVLACTGPVGLPVLWFSPKFSPTSKILTSLLFLGITVVFPIALTIYWVEIALRPLVETFEQANR